MPWWPHVMPALAQLGCDGLHIPSVEFLLPVVRMVPWELAIPWTSGTFRFLTKPLCLARITSCYLVFSCLWFHFPKPLYPDSWGLPFTTLDVLTFIEVTKGKPIMACFHTITLVLAIFYDEKYLK